MNKRVLFFLIFTNVFVGCTTTKKKLNIKYEKHPLAIVQGVTGKSETFISVLSHRSMGDLKFFYTEESGRSSKKQVYSFLKKHSPDGKRTIEQIQIKTLEPQKTYRLFVKSNGRVVDERTFKSLRPNAGNVRIGVASCFDDRLEAATGMWQSYLNKFLSVNFFIGDNVYVDRLDSGLVKPGNREQMWKRYLQAWDRIYFYHSSSLSPTYYLWDDHDYGKNNGGGEFVNKDAALDIFNTFHPTGSIEGFFKKTVGAGSVLTAYGQKFIFIDSRFFREGSNGSRWGKKQRELVLNELKASKAGVNWLIQGDQFFGTHHPFESFEKDHAKDFKETMKLLRSTGKKIVFVSGDRHLTEIMKIEKKILKYPTYEITSSGMHAKVFPDTYEKYPNPRGEVGKSGVFNYTVIEIDPVKVPELKFEVTSYGAKDWVHYTKEIDL